MNTPQPRTLTDELNSVLRAHSLQAPEPGATVDSVLGRVGALPAINHRRRPPRWVGPASKWVGAAAIVGLSGAGLVALGKGSNDSKSSSRAETAAGAASSASGSAGSGGTLPAAQSALASGLTSTSSVQNPKSSDQSAGAYSVPAPGCVQSTGAPLALVVTGASLEVVESYCPSQRASEVVVTTHENSTPRVVGTLISAQQGLLVQSVAVSDSAVQITVIQHPAPAEPPNPGPDTGANSLTSPQGTVQQLSFITTDGVSFTRSAATLVTPQCTAAQVKVAISPVSAAASLPAVLTLSSTGAACAISGYPTVAAADGVPLSQTRSLFGSAGGVRRQLYEPAPVLSLGQEASSLIEAGPASSAPEAICQSGQAIVVTVPGSAAPVSLTYSIGSCQLQVHPFVAGTTGSD